MELDQVMVLYGAYHLTKIEKSNTSTTIEKNILNNVLHS